MMRAVENTGDTTLALQLMAGDANAFERFVDEYHTKLFRYSYSMCGQREDAEEVAQETLMKVFTNLKQLREPQGLKAWVFRIARNACLTKRRKSIFAPQHELSLDDFHPHQDSETGRLEIADWSTLPDDLAANAEFRRTLASAVHDLPELYRSVFLLRDVEGVSTEQAAEILDVSNDVIKTRLHRARLALRQKLDGFVSQQTAGQPIGQTS